MNVGADLFTEIGDLVDKGDLGRQEGVAGVFDQLGGFQTGEHDRRFDQKQRAVKFAHDRARAFAVGADDHPIGAHKIANRRALAQKFGV